MRIEDYTMEYCPYCDTEVVIHAHGVTRCPLCGMPLAPCSVCHDERGGCKNGIPCPYGCDGKNDDIKPVTMPDITFDEMQFVIKNWQKYKEQSGESWTVLLYKQFYY